jgi:DNA-binding transcriptional MocR family regulator
MHVKIDRGSSVPIYRQISQFLRTQILQGGLPEGYRLPPERALAKTLGVNRTTVMNAYAELKADGLVHGRVGDGTRVAAVARETPARQRDVQAIRWSDFARLSIRPSDDEVRKLLALSEEQGVIVLSVGFPALEAIPLRLLQHAAGEVFEQRGASALFYAPAEGVSSFREALAGLMANRGASLGPEEIVVTSGSQQALDIVARTLIEPGDTVVVEEPTYMGALQCFRAAGARLMSVPVDGEGMRTDLLASLLGRCSPKFIYTLPTFQNPSGSVMSLERRMRLLDLAYRFRVPIVEDDVYGELWYDEAPPPPLRALDRHGYVLYAGSFSKALCPGLRVGWIAGPRSLTRRLVQVKQLMDLQAPTLSQMIIERLLVSGEYARHVETARKRYAPRRDAMEKALKRHARGWAEWSRPGGGFYYWCRVETSLPIAALAAEAAEKKVSILPGSTCTAVEAAENRIRLSFSCAKPEEIEEGITRLARVVRRASARAHAVSPPVDATRPMI